MINYSELIILFAIALISNTFSAMAGGGAGLLQLPALIFLGLPFPIALATHKIATVALGAGATIKHVRTKHTTWFFVLILFFTGIPGVIIGANTILKISPQLAQILLGVLTISLGVYSYFKASLGHQHQPRNRHASGIFIGGCMLFFLGFLNGSLTSGTGLFVTIWLIVWFGFDFKHATAYAMIVVGLFWNGAGALTLALQSPVEWSWLPALVLGSLTGGYLGAHLATVFGNKFIKRTFEIITILVGVALLLKI